MHTLAHTIWIHSYLRAASRQLRYHAEGNLNLRNLLGSACRKSAVHRSAVRSNASSKFLQNYAGGRVRQPRTPNTSAERKFPKPNYTKAIPCQKNCFTLDSHMLTSSSFFSLQTQHDQSRGNTNTTSKQTNKNQRTRRNGCVPCVDLSYVKLCDTAALVH